MATPAAKKKAKNNFRLSVVTKTTKGALNQLTASSKTRKEKGDDKPDGPSPVPAPPTEAELAAQSGIQLPEDTASAKWMIDLELSKDMPLIRAASVDELVRKLIDARQPPHYTQSFILTYRAFITPAELFKKIAAYYTPTAGEKMQRRILQVLKSWIEHYILDFQDEEQLEKLLDEFIDFKVEPDQQMEAHELRKSNEQRKGLRDAERTAMSATATAEKDKPKAGNTAGAPVVNVADLSEDDLAKQITALESEMFLAIRPRECLNQAWNKKEKEQKAPNILAMISHFNTAGQWVTTEIVQQYSLKPRAQLIAKFIGVLKRLMEMKNYQGVMEVLAGLYSSPVRRLTKTWEEVPAALKDDMATIEKTMSHQSCYKNYRALLRAVPSGQPCIPYLGMFLQDLTFIGDGNPDLVDNGLVNFYKHQKSAKVLADIQRLQEASHTRLGGIIKNPTITSWLRHGKPCLEEKETYNVSLKIEPRNPSETLERLLMDEQQMRKQLTELQVRNATLEEANQKLQATVAYLSEQLGASQAHVRKTMAIGANSLAALRAQIKAEEEEEEEESEAGGEEPTSPRLPPLSPRGPLPRPPSPRAPAVVALSASTPAAKRLSNRRSGRRSVIATRKSVRGIQTNPLSGPSLLPTPTPAPAVAPPQPPQPTALSAEAGLIKMPLAAADEQRSKQALDEEEARKARRRALAAKPGAQATVRDRGLSMASEVSIGASRGVAIAAGDGTDAEPAPAPAPTPTPRGIPMILEPIGTTHAKAVKGPGIGRKTVTAAEPGPTLDDLLAARSAAKLANSSASGGGVATAPDVTLALRQAKREELTPLSFSLPEPDIAPPPLPPFVAGGIPTSNSSPAVNNVAGSPATPASTLPAATNVIPLSGPIKAPARKTGSGISRAAPRASVAKPVVAPLPDVYSFLADEGPPSTPSPPLSSSPSVSPLNGSLSEARTLGGSLSGTSAASPKQIKRSQTELGLTSSLAPLISPRGAPKAPSPFPDPVADSPLALPGESARKGTLFNRPQSLADSQPSTTSVKIQPPGRQHQYISMALSPQAAAAAMAAGAASGSMSPRGGPVSPRGGKPSAGSSSDMFSELEALNTAPPESPMYRSKPLPKPPPRLSQAPP